MVIHPTGIEKAPDAIAQPLPDAGAQRTLEVVRCNALSGTASRVRRLRHCWVWDWNGVELVVTQPFDPGEDVSYRIEEAFVSRDKPYAMGLR
jgi:hypothetical protein